MNIKMDSGSHENGLVIEIKQSLSWPGKLETLFSTKIKLPIQLYLSITPHHRKKANLRRAVTYWMLLSVTHQVYSKASVIGVSMSCPVMTVDLQGIFLPLPVASEIDSSMTLIGREQQLTEDGWISD